MPQHGAGRLKDDLPVAFGMIRQILSMLAVGLLATAGQAQESGIACLGNGSLAVYERKADIVQLFGPSYSAPSVMRVLLDSQVQVHSQRQKGTAIWQHTLTRSGKQIAVITDWVDSERPCLVRHIQANDSFQLTLSYAAKTEQLDDLADLRQFPAVTGAVSLRTPAGTFFYNTYPIPEESRHQLLVRGNAMLTANRITIRSGVSDIFVAGGPSYPECMTHCSYMLGADAGVSLDRTRKYWLTYTSQRKNFEAILGRDLPGREKLLRTIDDVAILLKTQQSREGGVLAGHYYHMAYVRDQYGVSRCLLKLGYYKEARQILEFYRGIWERKKELHNAQGMGVDAFHIHENDEVEITGYLVIQAFDYLRNTRDQAYLRTLFPMLEWAYSCQARNLIKYMLPFNGDETYVAGGLLPRSTLLDGSAEATLLFLTGGELLVNWAEEHRLWKPEAVRKNRSVLAAVRSHYAANFIDKDVLATNNPGRMNGEAYPQFRHGVCEVMGKPPCEFFGWTRRTDSNRYLCPVCYATRTLPAAKPEQFNLQSVSLTPYYIGATLFEDRQVRDLVKKVADNYKATGNFPSRPGAAGNIVGYDYGLFLYSLVRMNDPLQTEIYTKMMNVLDDTGAWVEYYQDGQPKGTRYRPWESGINLEAALTFAEGFGSKQPGSGAAR